MAQAHPDGATAALEEQVSLQKKRARATRKQKSGRIDRLTKARAAKLAKNDAETPETGRHQFVEVEEDDDIRRTAPILAEQPTSKDDSQDELVQMQSRSAMKLLPTLNTCIPEENTKELAGFNFIDVQLLANAISRAAVCKECRKGNLALKKNRKHGLALKLDLECDNIDCKIKKPSILQKDAVLMLKRALNKEEHLLK